MRKWISLVLAILLFIPVLPVMGMKARAAEEDGLRESIAAQYDAYAASIGQSNAHNAAVTQLLRHSLDHPGEYLEMDESDPFTASLFQSNLFREYVIETAATAVEAMHRERYDRLLIGGVYVSWHDFALQYGARIYDYDDELPAENLIGSSGTLAVQDTIYDGPRNMNDKAMILVVGSARCWMWFDQVAIDDENITYKVNLRMTDNFDFTGNYGAAVDEGFDTSTSMLITLLGRLFLNEYSWTATVGFELTVPNLCSHDMRSQNYRWGWNGTDLYAIPGNGNTENPLTRVDFIANDGSLRLYFEIADTVYLRHDAPWVVEFRMEGNSHFLLAEANSGAALRPYAISKSWDRVHFTENYRYIVKDQATGKETIKYASYQYGVYLPDHGYKTKDMHTYRLENRIAADGTNMVYLLVDGEELAPMDRVYHNSGLPGATYEYQDRTEDWINGRDIHLHYIYNKWTSMKPGLDIEYIQVWENGEDREPLLYYTDTTVEPTCTESGGIVRDCLFCGARFLKEETTQARGHAWDEGVVTTAPTCTAEGVMTYTCANDPGHTKTEPIPATGHMPVTDAAVDATCTTDGLTEGSHCETCGEVLAAQQPIPAPGHSWDEGSEVTKPTVNAPGTMLYTCTVCGELRGEEIPYESQIARLAGEHRYETAFKAADRMKENLGIKKFDAVVVASGTNFADALSGSYLAAVKNAPILLACEVEWVNDLVKDYIYQNLNENGTIYILGGEGAVPASFEEGLEDFAIRRLAGGNRFETNLLVLEEAGVGDKPILVCTGLDFADSLSASATKLPILLVYGDKLLPDQAAFLKANQGRDLYILGGEGAVSAKLESALTAYGPVERVAGNNRFETSTLIAEKFFNSPESAVLAYAWGFPDGLCGGPLATTMNAPLILTMANYEAKAADYIQANAISNAVILGGEKLISDGTVNRIFQLN